MDLAIVSSPSNLKKMLQIGEKPKHTMKMIREGYIGFLTIIDVATQYLWVFPIKNKSPPIDIINRSLKQRSIKHTDKSIITTSLKGYLSKLKSFQKNAEVLNFTIEDLETDDLFDIPMSSLYCSIRTDGGKEFMAKNIIDTI